MLTSIRIQNFKGFKDISVAGLSRISVIGGGNNIGKSSLLEAVFNTYDRIAVNILIKQFNWRGVLSIPFDAQKAHEIWTPCFYNYDLENEIRFQLSHSSGDIEEATIGLEKEFSTSIPTSNIDQLVDPSSGSDASTIHALRVFHSMNKSNTLESYRYFTDGKLENVIRKRSELEIPRAQYLSTRIISAQEDATKYGVVLKQNKEKFIIDSVSKFEPRIKDITPIPLADNLTVLHATSDLNIKIPINYFGDGTTKLVAYLAAILASEDGIVLIDEIENGFHYTKHELIWEILLDAAEQNNVQIIATTHSLEMTKAFNTVSINRKADLPYFELYKSANTQDIRVNKLDNETLSYKIDSNKPFRG